MKNLSNKKSERIPKFFIYFGVAALILFLISTTIFVIEICQKSFVINPIYQLMASVGFFGLLLTDVVAIAEWRKTQNKKE